MRGFWILVPSKGFRLQEKKVVAKVWNFLTEASGMSSGVHAIRPQKTILECSIQNESSHLKLVWCT
jgi:hypothetical protein